MGYEGVELFDLHGHAARRGRLVARRDRPRRLRPPRAARAVESELPDLAAEARTLGWRRLVVGWVDPSDARAGRSSRRLTAAAAAAAAHGLELGFHNHDAEVRRVTAAPASWTSCSRATTLFLELDLGWAWYAGAIRSPSSDRARGRCPLVHVKDFHSREPARVRSRRRRRGRLRARGAGRGRGRRRVAARRAGRDGRAGAGGRAALARRARGDAREVAA